MSPPRHWSTVAWPLVQALKPEPRTEQDMTTDISFDDHEREVLAVIDERDCATDWADQLAAAIANFLGQNIGEHSSANNPWRNAAEAMERHNQGGAW